MLKLVEKILEKYLAEAARKYEREVEMTIVDYFELLWQQPMFEERRALVKELTEAIRGIDLSTLRQIPNMEDVKKFVKSITPGDLADDDDWVTYQAKALIEWLEYRPRGR